MLILLRHGQSVSNAAGRLVGRSDPPLTDLGVRQAEAAGRYLAAERRAGKPEGPASPVTIVSSPLLRARSTAEIVAQACGKNAAEVEIEERLIELDYGELDGIALSELDGAAWSAWRADPAWRPPGGETLVELQGRVVAWCDDLRARAVDRELIAISHVSPIKAAASWALQAGPELSWRLSLGVATITRISVGGPTLVSFGEAGHLAALR